MVYEIRRLTGNGESPGQVRAAALTHALAISLAPGVRVNCVSPGWCATSLAFQQINLSNPH
jgi:NAD(P)-dependent dehydrogenase (short-subunit alcohol dehydrogenase family)